jgi:CRP-like cAMP-binding protein
LAIMRSMLQRRRFQAGEVIVQSGTPAEEMYFIARGRASATIKQAHGDIKRLGTFSSGMVFGEMGVLEHAPRSAEVIADTEVDCDLLKLEDFEKLGESHPHIKLTILRNLALLLSRILRKRNQEFSVFNY